MLEHPPCAEASPTEEPDAGNLHVRVCAGCDPFSRNLEASRRMGGEGELITFDNLMCGWVWTSSYSHPSGALETAPPSCRGPTRGGMGLARGVTQENPEPNG